MIILGPMKKLILASLSIVSIYSFAEGQPKWQPATDCRDNIRATACIVKPPTSVQDYFERPCQPGAESYVAQLQAAWDYLPPKLQKIYCHTRKIWIEEEMFSTGMASEYWEKVKGADGKDYYTNNGLILSLSKVKVFDTQTDLGLWLTHKEQTAFGLQMTDPISPLMPVFKADYHGFNARAMLIDLLMHEGGHFVDFANQVNRNDFMKCMDQNWQWIPDCVPPMQGAWLSISWEFDGSIRSKDAVFGGKPPCYYGEANGCKPEQMLDLNQATPIYREFFDSNAFVSPYAVAGPAEDFAESFLFYQTAKYLQTPTTSVDWSVAFADKPDQPISFFQRLPLGRLDAKMDYLRIFETAEWKYLPEAQFIPAEVIEGMKQPLKALNPIPCVR
jgi:hypothetical protein